MKTHISFSVLKYFALALLILSGCTIEEEQKEPYFSISGQISDVLMTEKAKQIQLMAVSGKVLASSEIAADGTFSIDSQIRPKPGYILKADTGFGEPIYAAYVYTGPTRDQVNLTPVTMLVHQLTQRHPDTSLSWAQRQRHGVKLLDHIGMASSKEWSHPELQSMDWNAISGYITREKMDLNSWSQIVADDMLEKDAALSAVNMQGFPLAHGGLLFAKLESAGNVERIEVIPGNQYAIPFVMQARDTESEYKFELTNHARDVTSLSIEDKTIVYDVSENAEPDKDLSFHFSIVNTENGYGRSISVPVEVMEIGKKYTIAEKKFDMGYGDYLTDPDTGIMAGSPSFDLVGVTNDPQLIDRERHMSLSKSVDENGRIYYSAFAQQQRAVGEITLPPYITLPAKHSDGLLPYIVSKASSDDEVNPQIRKTWFGYYAKLRYPEDNKSTILINKILTNKGCPFSYDTFEIECYWQSSSVLESDCAEGNSCAGSTPVLLVHGYDREEVTRKLSWDSEVPMGGGKKVWGNFPELLRNSGYAVYEFRWRTNASLSDMARNLADAIKIISEETNKKTHIIAHNIGGILARLYLQSSVGNIPNAGEPLFENNRLFKGLFIPIHKSNHNSVLPMPGPSRGGSHIDDQVFKEYSPAYVYADDVQSLVTLGTDYRLLHEDLRNCSHMFCAQMSYTYNELSDYRLDEVTESIPSEWYKLNHQHKYFMVPPFRERIRVPWHKNGRNDVWITTPEDKFEDRYIGTNWRDRTHRSLAQETLENIVLLYQDWWKPQDLREYYYLSPQNILSFFGLPILGYSINQLGIDRILTDYRDLPVDVLALIYLNDSAIETYYDGVIPKGEEAARTTYKFQRFYHKKMPLEWFRDQVEIVDDYDNSFDEEGPFYTDPCFSSSNDKKVCEKPLFDNRIKPPFGSTLFSHIRGWLDDSDPIVGRPKTDIRVHVKDITTGLPIENVVVVADVNYRVSGSDRTDADGGAIIEADFYPDVVYHITATAPGYIPYRFDNRYVTESDSSISNDNFGEILLTPRGTPPTSTLDVNDFLLLPPGEYSNVREPFITSYLTRNGMPLYMISFHQETLRRVPPKRILENLMPGQYEVISTREIYYTSHASMIDPNNMSYIGYLPRIDFREKIESDRRDATEDTKLLIKMETLNVLPQKKPFNQ